VSKWVELGEIRVHFDGDVRMLVHL